MPVKIQQQDGEEAVGAPAWLPSDWLLEIFTSCSRETSRRLNN